MLELAKLLHHRGLHITFVKTEFNHRRFLKAPGRSSLDGLPDFRFETIPDNLLVGSSNEDATQDLVLLTDAIIKDQLLAPFRELLLKLNGQDIGPPVTSIVYDHCMTFTITAAEGLGVPIEASFSINAGSFMGYKQFRTLVEKGPAPLKGVGDESCLTNGFLDPVIDWIPGQLSNYKP